MATDLVFVDIAAGSQHTCGLLANGSYACWGESLHFSDFTALASKQLTC